MSESSGSLGNEEKQLQSLIELLEAIDKRTPDDFSSKIYGSILKGSHLTSELLSRATISASPGEISLSRGNSLYDLVNLMILQMMS